jgi:hypothetical protein
MYSKNRGKQIKEQLKQSRSKKMLHVVILTVTLNAHFIHTS